MKRTTKDRRKTVAAFVADDPEPKADKKLCSKKERRSKKDAIHQSILDWSAGMDEDLIDSPNGFPEFFAFPSVVGSYSEALSLIARARRAGIPALSGASLRFCRSDEARALVAEIVGRLGLIAPDLDDFDSGDIWGSLLGLGFSLAFVGLSRSIPIPDALDFDPKGNGPEPEDFERVGFLSDAQLGEVLSLLPEWIDRAKALGLDY